MNPAETYALAVQHLFPSLPQKARDGMAAWLTATHRPVMEVREQTRRPSVPEFYQTPEPVACGEAVAGSGHTT